MKVRTAPQRRSAGAFVRSVWRTHFYAAIFAAPILVLLSVTGLAILYTDPINDLILNQLTRVEPGTTTKPLDELRLSADARAPKDAYLALVNTPREADQATSFQYTVDESSYTDVYVNQYTGAVTGVHTNGADIVGWANRLHGYLGNDSITVPLPALSHLIKPESGPLIQEYVLGGLIIEIAAIWALVLALSGLYLWWPRRLEKGKRLLIPRWAKGGRLRWRDLHASAGVLGAGTLLIFIISGMPWSGYWGPGWRAAATTLTPPTVSEQVRTAATTSSLAKEGDIDRFGRRISWATQDFVAPSSPGSAHQHAGGIDGRTGSSPSEGVQSASNGTPAVISLSDVHKAALEEGMRPGYRIVMPANATSDPKNPSYGSFTLENYWPSKIEHETTVYLNQFTGSTIAAISRSQMGALSAATEVGVLTHMGTQFGILNTIAMTLGCLLILVSVATSLVMWWKRRPAGGVGLPRRPARPRLPVGLMVIAGVLALIYPLWGASLVLVLLVDSLLVQRIPLLRRWFNLNPRPDTQ